MGLVKTELGILIPPTIEQPISSNEIATAKLDTFINRTAVSPQTYPDLYGSLLSYADGSVVIVEYFRRREAFINNQTLDTGLSLERAAIHSSYDLVHSFEMNIKDQLSVEINAETNETTITGVAHIMPGFKPNPGDIFYLRLPDSQIGAFAVDLSTPLSIHKGAHHEINFHLYGYVTDVLDQKLRSSVVEELYYDTQAYFGDEVALLSSTSYNQLKLLASTRAAIITALIAKFYKRNDRTLICPVDIFDTYIIEFLNNKISISDCRTDICQLSLTYIDDFSYTIFAAILNQDVTQLTLTGYTLATYQNFLWDTNVSVMDDYRIVRVVDNVNAIDDLRGVSVRFSPTDTSPKVCSYYFSDRFYYALIKSFEQGSMISDIVPLLPEMSLDLRIFPNLSNTFYSMSDDTYHDMTFFDVHSKVTGSNNDLHLPELEYIVLNYLLNNELDIAYLTTKVLPKFPFVHMKPIDQFVYLPIILHLCDTAIPRIR